MVDYTAAGKRWVFWALFVLSVGIVAAASIAAYQYDPCRKALIVAIYAMVLETLTASFLLHTEFAVCGYLKFAADEDMDKILVRASIEGSLVALLLVFMPDWMENDAARAVYASFGVVLAVLNITVPFLMLCSDSVTYDQYIRETGVKKEALSFGRFMAICVGKEKARVEETVTLFESE